jgi:hypothetical protein
MDEADGASCSRLGTAQYPWFLQGTIVSAVPYILFILILSALVI